MIALALPLVTERLTLREIAGDDAFAFAKIMSHPRMMRKVVIKGEEKNVSMYTSFFDGIDAFMETAIHSHRENPRTIYSLAIVENKSKKVIGNLELSENDLSDIELGFCIHPDFQKQGYAHEASHAVCIYAFQNGVQTITATTRSDNKASQSLLKKLGMKLIGYKPTGYMDGQPIREYWMVERIPFLAAAAQQKTAAAAAV